MMDHDGKCVIKHEKQHTQKQLVVWDKVATVPILVNPFEL